MHESNMSLDETNNELIIVCEDVYLQYSKNEPEQGIICLRKDGLPDVKIELKYWGALYQALSDYHMFIGWAKAREELEELYG